MSVIKKFIAGNEINNALYKAIYSRDLEKVISIVDSVGVSHCVAWGNGNDLLLTALECKHVDLAKILVNKGCNLQGIQTGISGVPKSIIHLAVRLGDEELVTMLIDKAKHFVTEIEQGDSPLHVAIAEGHGNIVKVLIKSGADVECRSGGGMTPLHLATLRGNCGVIEELLDAGANLESKDSNGKTSLFLAVSSGNQPVVRRLLELGANCKCKSKNGQTPLLDATNKRYIEIVKDLLAFGGDLNDKNAFGQTPLHIACMQKNNNLICTLLNAGANINAVDNNGMVPCDAVVKKVALPQSTCSMYFENSNVSYVVGKHLTKLKVGGFSLNKKNETFYDMFCKMYCDEILVGNAVVSAPSSMLISATQNCKDEIELMKVTKSSDGFTMFDVFKKLKDPLGVVSKIEVGFMQSIDLQDKCPLYAGIIEHLLKNAVLRNDLISSSDEWLSFLLCSSKNYLPTLPEEIRILILSYLDNDELKQFILSAGEA